MDTGDLNSDGCSANTTVDLLSLLECPICISLICEPITLPCGHSFCRVCVVDALRKSNKKCATCRAVCHISPEIANENVMLRDLAMALDSTQYLARVQETSAIKDTWKATYPIFFYNEVLFPGDALNLHLFEPRYKLMMKRIVEGSRSFAYVCPSGEDIVGDVALVARLDEAEFLADGRCLIESSLANRHKIISHFVETGTQGLHFCSLEPYCDAPIASDNADALAEAAAIVSHVTAVYNDISTRHPNILKTFGKPPQVTASSAGSSSGSGTCSYEEFSLWLARVLPPSSGPQKREWLVGQDTCVRLRSCREALRGFEQSIMAASSCAIQ